MAPSRRGLAAGTLAPALAVPALAPVALAVVVGVATRIPGTTDRGAAAILHPPRRPVTRTPAPPFETVTFRSGPERLEGWLLKATGEHRELVVYLQGIADSRQSGLGAARRLTRQGYDVFDTVDAPLYR